MLKSAATQDVENDSSLCPAPSSQFILYRDSKLFVDRRHKADDVIVASGVVKSQLGKSLDLNNLSEPVEMSFEVSNEVNLEVYWDHLWILVYDIIWLNDDIIIIHIIQV